MKGIRWVYTPGALPKLLWLRLSLVLFTVKSAYQLLEKLRKEETRGECSNSASYQVAMALHLEARHPW
jgi:hypothetical protein